jgi:chaperonin GroES
MTMGYEDERARETGAATKEETFVPLGDRILVRPFEEEEVTAGGIVIPDNARERPQRGEVLAVGPGGNTINGTAIPVQVAVGDVVVFSRYGGTELKLAGEELLILREQDVLGRVAS